MMTNDDFQGHKKPIEYAALADNLEGVKILFPLTQPIKQYQKWTVDGIMKYNRSAGAIKKVSNHFFLSLSLDGPHFHTFFKQRYHLPKNFVRLSRAENPYLVLKIQSC